MNTTTAQTTQKTMIALPYHMPPGAVVRVRNGEELESYVITSAAYIKGANQWQYTGYAVTIDGGNTLTVRTVERTFWSGMITRVSRWGIFDWYMYDTFGTPDGSEWFEKAV